MKQPIFNSLGSGYSPEVVKLATAAVLNPFQDNDQALLCLEQRLEEYFQGVAVLVYKGRDAIELALRAVTTFTDKASSVAPAVLTQGLACHAIEEGVLRAGFKPVYVDLEKNTLGPSIRTLEEGMRRAKALGKNVQAVFIQHTLGYANPVSEVRAFCDRHGLVLIEDLAQSFGARDNEGCLLGTKADIVIHSFGRDKVLDAVSGGAVVVRHAMLKLPHREVIVWKRKVLPQQLPPKGVVRKEMMYPQLTRWIRQTHTAGLGKMLFQAAKTLRLLTSPIASPTREVTLLPPSYARLVLWQLEHLDEQLAHRRQIAQYYCQALKQIDGVRCLASEKTLEHDIHLRVPVLFDDARYMNLVIDACRKAQIFISDRWYRSVVDSGSLQYETRYEPKSCPVAESVATRLLNLPTHRYITLEDAQRVIQVISQVQGRYYAIT